MFIYHFIMSNAVVSAAFLIILLLGRPFDKRLSPKAKYLCRFPLLILLWLAFLPELSFFRFNFSGKNFNTDGRLVDTVKAAAPVSINDFYIINNFNIYKILTIIWIGGIIVNFLLYFTAFVKIRRIIKAAHFTGDYKGCRVYVSKENILPFSFGLIKRNIILPFDKTAAKELIYIKEHEYIHYLHRDNITNLMLCILNALYWFNPIIYYVFSKIRLDMEIYCDYSVIKSINCTNKEYGNTILSLAVKGNNAIKLGNNIADAKSRLKIRLINIMEYGKTYGKGFSLLLMTVIAVILVISLCIVNIFGYNAVKFKFKSQNTEYISLEKAFNGYNGCFVLYNETEDKYIVYNKKTAEKRFPPYSTYKIAIAANALENKIISEQNNTLLWNGAVYPFEQWNGSQNLSSAFKNSVNWYFQSLESRLSYMNKRAFLNKINYGSQSIGFDSVNYWLDGALKISAAEQVEFLKNFFGGKYNLSHIDTVKENIRLSDNLYGKTGSGKDMGWFVGFIENNSENYYFAVCIQGDNADGVKAFDISKEIFNNLKLNIDN